MADGGKMCVDLCVRKAENFQTVSGENGSALRVIGHPLGFVVLGAIDFNDQLGGITVEIDDERANDTLAIDFSGVALEEEVPELALLRGHVVAQFAGAGEELVVFGGMG